MSVRVPVSCARLGFVLEGAARGCGVGQSCRSCRTYTCTYCADVSGLLLLTVYVADASISPQPFRCACLRACARERLRACLRARALRFNPPWDICAY